MIQINVHEAKTHLSRYLAELEKGEVILLCRRNQPIAEIRAVGQRDTEKRPIGLAKGSFSVPASFFDELPEETVALFSGEAL
jgi:antitoxin (DNA-binding transcriptional repressor) of toxin-antitoxin stability system